VAGSILVVVSFIFAHSLGEAKLMNKASKVAARRAGLVKVISAHTFR
jgi:hypothetical protein